MVTAFLKYQLPPGVMTVLDSGESVYQLTLQKQPGMKSESVAVTITLPENATLIEALPAPTRVEGTRLTFEMEFVADKILTIRFR